MTTPQTFKELAELKTLATELIEIGKLREARKFKKMAQEAEIVLRGPEVFQYLVVVE